MAVPASPWKPFILLALALVIMPGRASAQQQPRSMLDLLRQQYGIPVPPVCLETDTTVGTSAVRVGLNDPASTFVLMFNLGTSNCFRSGLPTVTTTTGQLIPANGGFLEFDFKTDAIIPTQEQWIVCSGAGDNIHMQRCDLQ